MGDTLEKPSLNLDEQVGLLVERGLKIKDSDETRLRRFLFDVNYFRASGYWRYFQHAPHLGENEFREGFNFDHIRDVYQFDFDLRNRLLYGIAVIEIALRSRLAHLIAQEGNSRTYLELSFYAESPHREKLIKDINAEIRRSKEPFIQKHQTNSQIVPIWAAIEVMSFGTVSKIFKQIASDDVRFAISKSFKVNTPDIAVSIIRSMSTLRNICAHQGRVWNRSPIINPPQVPKKLIIETDRTIYERTPWAWIVTLSYLVDSVNQDTTYSE